MLRKRTPRAASALVCAVAVHSMGCGAQQWTIRGMETVLRDTYLPEEENIRKVCTALSAKPQRAEKSAATASAQTSQGAAVASQGPALRSAISHDDPAGDMVELLLSLGVSGDRAEIKARYVVPLGVDGAAQVGTDDRLVADLTSALEKVAEKKDAPGAEDLKQSAEELRRRRARLFEALSEEALRLWGSRAAVGGTSGANSKDRESSKEPRVPAETLARALVEDPLFFTRRMDLSPAVVAAIVAFSRSAGDAAARLAASLPVLGELAQLAARQLAAEVFALALDPVLDHLERAKDITKAGVARAACDVELRGGPQELVSSRVVKRAILRFLPEVQKGSTNRRSLATAPFSLCASPPEGSDDLTKMCEALRRHVKEQSGNDLDYNAPPLLEPRERPGQFVGPGSIGPVPGQDAKPLPGASSVPLTPSGLSKAGAILQATEVCEDRRLCTLDALNRAASAIWLYDLDRATQSEILARVTRIEASLGLVDEHVGQVDDHVLKLVADLSGHARSDEIKTLKELVDLQGRDSSRSNRDLMKVLRERPGTIFREVEKTSLGWDLFCKVRDGGKPVDIDVDGLHALLSHSMVCGRTPERELALSIQGLNFAPCAVAPKDQGRSLERLVGNLCSALDASAGKLAVSVVGHTDAVPIGAGAPCPDHPEWRRNQDLAAARAETVQTILLNGCDTKLTRGKVEGVETLVSSCVDPVTGKSLLSCEKDRRVDISLTAASSPVTSR